MFWCASRYYRFFKSLNTAAFWHSGSLFLQQITKQFIMEKLDYVEEIKSSVTLRDTLSFHYILQELKKIDSFEGALMLAKGFASSQIRQYEQFVYQALVENPKWGTVIRDGYGQPLFRQFFLSGAIECMSKYLNDMSVAIENILPQMIEDAMTWHRESIWQLECLPEKLPFRCLRGELINVYAIGERDYEEILPIIRSHDIVVRQHLMLCEMGAYALDSPNLKKFLHL